MGCNCKSEDGYKPSGSKISLGKSIIKYSLKTIVFLMSLVLIPVILVASIWFMFNTLVLTKEVEIKPLLMMIAKKFKSNPYDDSDYDDEEDDEEDEYELIGVENITGRSNQ